MDGIAHGLREPPVHGVDVAGLDPCSARRAVHAFTVDGRTDANGIVPKASRISRTWTRACMGHLPPLPVEASEQDESEDGEGRLVVGGGKADDEAPAPEPAKSARAATARSQARGGASPARP